VERKVEVLIGQTHRCSHCPSPSSVGSAFICPGKDIAAPEHMSRTEGSELFAGVAQ